MTKKRQRRSRRLVFVTMAVLLVAVVIEVFGFTAWWLWTGTPFSWSRAESARMAAIAGEARPGADPRDEAATQQLALGACVPHPYLGYVYDPSQSDDPERVSRFGLVDDTSPLLERSPERYIVGVVGGSLALLLCASAESVLIDALHRSPALHDKDIEVVLLGIGGYKQPQQLFSVQLAIALGGQFDCIVNLDGFNEVALVDENVPHGVPAWFPRSWSRLMDKSPTRTQQLRLGHIAFLAETRQSMAESAGCLWWSPTAQLIWLLRDRRVASRLAEERASAERASFAPSFAITGPGPSSPNVVEARREMAAVWRRCSSQLHAACQTQGTHYFHFLQPNQYVPNVKPIGLEEAKIAIVHGSQWEKAVIEGYPLLQQEAEALLETGVTFEDLTGIFKDRPEPLYFDNCCHLNHAGYTILAEHIAAVIRRRIELSEVHFNRIRVSPPTLECSSPLRAERVLVFGVEADGTEHEITGTGFGTRIRSLTTGMSVVGSGGSVLALRRGSDLLVIEHGEHRIEVPVVADWPDVVDHADGTPADGGITPRIQFVDAEPEAGLEVHCTGLPARELCFLIISTKPIPRHMPERFGMVGVKLLPIPREGSSATLMLPDPASNGQPMFLRCVVFEPGLKSFHVVSNALVLTRG